MPDKEETMAANGFTRIEITDKQNESNEGREVTPLKLAGQELELRVMPLVVIAIIAVLIALLLPA